jgi:hypothetical protein
MGPRNTRARYFYGRPIGLPGAAGMMRTLPYHPQRWALTLNTQRAAFLNPNFGQLQVKLRDTERQCGISLAMKSFCGHSGGLGSLRVETGGASLATILNTLHLDRLFISHTVH